MGCNVQIFKFTTQAFCSSPCGDVGWNCKNGFIEFNNIAFIPIRGWGLKFRKITVCAWSKLFIPHAGVWVVIKSKEREYRKKSGSSPCGGVGWNNYIWDELLSESGFIPIRGCRLKFPLRFSNFSPLGVHPHAGVWIEIIFLLSQVLTKKFIPLRGCGLKFRFRASSTSGTPFIPIRGCGLKSSIWCPTPIWSWFIPIRGCGL